MVVPGGAVLTGGGAMLKGMPEAAEQILNMPARMGLPHAGLIAAPEPLLEPLYASALALVAYPQSSVWSRGGAERKVVDSSRWLRKVKGLFKDLL